MKPRELTAIIDDLQAKLLYGTVSNDNNKVEWSAYNGLRAMLEVARGLLNSNTLIPLRVGEVNTPTYTIRAMLTPYCAEFNVPMECE